MYNYTPNLDLDLTGINRDNLVKDEPHTLTKGDYRGIVPKKGLFYEGSMVILDGTNTLIRNVDYICVELHQTLSDKTGKAVFAGVVITNKEVSSNVVITYQAVGGPYGVDNEAIANLYNSVIHDNRPVHWNNVIGKPSEFPPSEHDHVLQDIVNWTPIIHQLERITMAISISQVEILKKTVAGMLGGFRCGELPKILPNEKIVQYDAMLYFHTRRKHNGPTTIDTENCQWNYGRMASFEIDTSGHPVGHQFWWRFYKADDETINLPIQLSGSIFGTGDIVKIYVYVPGIHTHESETIYIGVNDKPFINEFSAVTYRLGFSTPFYGSTNYGMILTTDGPDSDFRNITPVYAEPDVARATYILDHTSMINYYNI